MSIWSSLTPEIQGEDYDDEGRSIAEVACAYGFDQSVRVSVYAVDERGQHRAGGDAAVLLSPADARRFAEQLLLAADSTERALAR